MCQHRHFCKERIAALCSFPHNATLIWAGVALIIMFLTTFHTFEYKAAHDALTAGIVASSALIGCLGISHRNQHRPTTPEQYRLQVLVLIGLGIVAKMLMDERVNGWGDAALAFNSAVAGSLAAFGWPPYRTTAIESTSEKTL